LKYKMFESECEICGKIFRRSGLIENPPRFCGRDCLNKSRVGQRHEKYTISEEWHEPIKKMYANGVGMNQVNRMAKRIGVPRTKITNFAKSKGWLSKSNSRDYSYFWSDKEISIVEKNGHCAPITVHRKLKAAGFNRSVSAVEVKRTQLRVCQNKKGMSANELSLAMGVDVHNILNAIKNKKLTARRRDECKRNDFLIEDNDIKEYIKNWLPEINIKYCDKYWLVDLLAG